LAAQENTYSYCSGIYTLKLRPG